MFTKFLLAPALISAGLLIVGDAALARGPRGGGGGSRGGSVSRGGYSGAYRGGYGYGGYGRGYSGWYGPGWGWYGGYGWPYYDYGSGYYPDANYYGNPPVVMPPAYSGAGNAQAPAVANNDAHIRVIVPDPQATVWFDGKATQQTGSDRFFETPPLTPGGNYHYRIRATWMEDGHQVTKERTLTVNPGQFVVVNFRQ